MTTWWDEHNRSLESAHPSMARGLLPAHLVTLLNDVEARFFATSTVPGWPDPHFDPTLPWPGRRAPAEDEYSRATDPDRYRILHERVGAWLTELVARGLATVEKTAGDRVWLLDNPYPSGRAQRVVPRRGDALSLVVESWKGGDDQSAGVTVGAGGDPAALLDVVPVCGCDACDDGSGRLLQQIDEWCVRVVDGSMHIDLTPDHTTIRYADGSMRRAAGETTTTGAPIRSLKAAADRRARRAAIGSDHYTARGVPWDPSWPPRDPIAR